MDRMRAGLTGLGLVFLATLAASVLFAPDTSQAPQEPSEPLAQLGVAPGPEKATPPAMTSGPPGASPGLAPGEPAAGRGQEPEIPLDDRVTPGAATAPLPPRDGDQVSI